MKIGEFCKKHNITHDTVRHYIDIGLLIPRKDGHHYRFDESHNQDIREIIEFKNLDFSLLEIQKMLNFNRLAGRTSKEFINYYLNILENKKEYAIESQKRFKEIEHDLNKKMEDIVSTRKGSKKLLGINIDSLEILYCPICNKNLNINDGSIENNMLINGRILCDCGYKASIKDGIYIGYNYSERLEKKNIPSKLDFMEYSSTEFINFYHDGMYEIRKKVQERIENPKYILELENCSGTFLMQNIEHLKEKTTYIIVNKDKSRLEKLKENLELNNDHERFIFICEKFDSLPIKLNSIDVIIDHWMTKDYALENGEFLLNHVSKFLGEKGILAGAYPYVTSLNNDTYILELKEKGYFNDKYISEKLNDLGFGENSITKIGPIIEKNPYNEDIKDKRLYLNIFSSIKKV